MILHASALGEGDPVVLLHGLFGSARNFGAVRRRLADAGGWRVIALDLRNHGASPHAADMRYAAMAADVAETLAAIGAWPAVLIGHSMGGKVAMRLALDRGEAVPGLLIADIAPIAYPPHFAAIAAAMAALDLADITRAAADTALAGAVPDPGLRGFLLQNLIPGRPGAWRVGLAEILAALDTIGGWEAPPGTTYAGPTLVLSGERSDYVRPEHRPLFRALFPRARFVALRHAGHWLHADQPDAFCSAAAAFLAGVARDGGGS
ncbi:MAG: alpha/beta fold hydrolase [Rhodospirillales bacterium]|nr:alpha/beta fold hydrolase [Rhodospirillales bacterium]